MRREARRRRSILEGNANDPTRAENVLNGCPELLLVTGAAVIDPDRVDLGGIDPGSELMHHARAAVGSITPGPVEMRAIEGGQDPSSVEEVVDQAIDGDRGPTDLDPTRSPWITRHQERCEGHGDILRDAATVRLARAFGSIRDARVRGRILSLVDALANIEDATA
jgi:hypothetical protein